MIKLNGLKGVSAWLVYNKIVFSLLFIRRFNFQHVDQLTLIAGLKQCETLAEFKAVAEQLTTASHEVLQVSMADCVQLFKDAPPEDKEAMLIEAITFTAIDDDDTLRLLGLHQDANGAPYTKHSISSIPISEIIPMMVESLIACSNTNCDFSLMNKGDFESLGKVRLNINDEANEVLAQQPDLDTGSTISIAVKRLLTKLNIHGIT